MISRSCASEDVRGGVDLGVVGRERAVRSSVLHARAHHNVEKSGSECVRVSGHCRVALSLFTLLPPATVPSDSNST